MTVSAEHLANMRNRRAELLRQRAGKAAAEVVLVTGPPCSGKSTHVAENASPGDVVIDFDALAVALGSPDSHDHPEELRPVVVAAWVSAIAEAVRRPGRVWLVRVWPDAGDFARASSVVTLDVPADVCKARATAAGRPGSWASVIDSWWASR